MNIFGQGRSYCIIKVLENFSGSYMENNLCFLSGKIFVLNVTLDSLTLRVFQSNINFHFNVDPVPHTATTITTAGEKCTENNIDLVKKMTIFTTAWIISVKLISHINKLSN